MATDDGALTSPTLLHQLGEPGNDPAWRAFLARYGPLIHAWCRRAGLRRDDAEEVSAAVLAKLVPEMRRFVYDPARRFRGWLKTVVDRSVAGFWRQRSRHPDYLGSGDSGVRERLEAIPAPPDTEGLVRELDDTLVRDLQQAQQVAARVQARVEPRTWQAFQRTALGGEPAAEVARELGLTVGAVYEAKRRVGRMLREQGAKLQGQGDDARGDEA
jgi:RNA polymerase sigma-70 factor (ECF subfamily)